MTVDQEKKLFFVKVESIEEEVTLGWTNGSVFLLKGKGASLVSFTNKAIGKEVELFYVLAGQDKKMIHHGLIVKE